MGSFRINGGKNLKGVIYPQGAKNEALQILCATLLSDQTITIENIPDIKDVNLLIDLLDGMAVNVDKVDSTTYKFKSDSKADYIINELMKARADLNNSTLRRERYNLIKEIQSNYNLQKIMSSKVTNYKTYASIYTLFEYNKSFYDKSVKVLVENQSISNPRYFFGRTPFMQSVYLESNKVKIGEEMDVKITSCNHKSLYGIA